MDSLLLRGVVLLESGVDIQGKRMMMMRVGASDVLK